MHLLPPYQTDLHRLIGILQQWQCLLVPMPGAAAEATCSATTPTLADVQALMQALQQVLQQTFGPMTTLEAVIQALIASDLRVQVEARRQRRCPATPLLAAVA